MQAKLTLVPFDLPEAEAELSGGAFIEYSGPPLAMFKLTQAMMLFTLPVFLVVLYARRRRLSARAVGGRKLLRMSSCGCCWCAVTIVLRNTTPRVRTDQAVRFFWGPLTAAGG